MKSFRLVFLFIFMLLCARPAQAYIGPGLGSGVLAVILGLITSFFLAILGIFWYPIKRFLKKRKKQNPRDNKK